MGTRNGRAWSLFDEQESKAPQPQDQPWGLPGEAPSLMPAITKLERGAPAPQLPAPRRTYWVRDPPDGGVLYGCFFDMHDPPWADDDVEHVRRQVADDDVVIYGGQELRLVAVWDVQRLLPWRRYQAWTIWHLDSELVRTRLAAWPSRGMAHARRWVTTRRWNAGTHPDRYSPPRDLVPLPYTLLPTSRPEVAAELNLESLSWNV